MTTSKVTKVVNSKPYNGQNGTVYYHLLQMDNGDKINIGKKKELSVGDEITYEITETGQQEYNKAKSAQKEFTGGFSGKSKGGNGSFALSYAKDLVIGGVIDIKDILTTAERFKTWLDGSN